VPGKQVRRGGEAVSFTGVETFREGKIVRRDVVKVNILFIARNAESFFHKTLQN
jgi:hypothetical protein